MTETLLAFAALLTLSLFAGLARVLLGPTPADRIIAAQLLSTGGVAILLLLAEATDERAFQDVALILVLLASMATVVYVRGRAEPRG